MTAQQVGYYLQLAGLVVTGAGLLYTWVDWVRGDPEHPARIRFRRAVAKVRRRLGLSKTHSVRSDASTTWNVEMTADGRASAPEEGLAGRIQALEHRVENLEIKTDRRFDKLDKTVADLRTELIGKIESLRADLAQLRQEHLARTRQVAVGGLGIAVIGIVLSIIGTVVSYNAG